MTAEEEFQAGVQHHQFRDLRGAEDAYRRALAQDSAHAPAWQRLGILLHQTGRVQESIDALENAARLRPDAADIHNNLGTVLALAGRALEALKAFTQALALNPNFPETHNNIANLFRDLGRVREAIAGYREAVRLRPTYADAWNSLGMLLRFTGDLDGAADAFTRVIEARPDWPDALNNLASIFQETRRIDDAVGLFRRALSLKNDPRIWDNLLLALYGQEGVTPEQLRDEHARWNQAIAAMLEGKPRHFTTDRSPDRWLRVAYISPDFREHPVGRLITPVLANHDRTLFEIFCYSDVKAPDAITARHRELAHHWVDSSQLDDEQLTARILHDQIDVLIDLTLHTANNRLLVFARRPAPVEITWAGYPGSTGLTSIDYRLTDPQLDPLNADRESLYPEKLIRFPNCFWCFDPQDPNPVVNDLPAKQNGFITFGCLNQFGKISDPTLTRWAAVMRAVENSRLRVLAPRGRARDELAAFMSRRDISGDRIIFMDRRPRPEYLKLYHDIDICLDTAPYTGHTTTLDALYMGVPLVTRPGQTAVSRGGLSILSQVRLSEMVGTDDAGFVHIAATLAENLDRLAGLRSTLRNRLMSSSIADTRTFTRDLESAIRTAWRQWCETR